MKAKKVSDGQITTNRVEEISAAVAGGLMSCHETTTGEEAINKSRLGVMLMAREGSVAKNVAVIVQTILSNNLDTRNCCFCTDDKLAEALVKEGHIDHVIRRAVEEGLDPVTAVQMATINAAEYFGVDRDLGSITPGKVADVLLIKDLRKFKVQMVLVDGKMTAEDGRLLVEMEPYVYPDFAKKTMFLKRKVTPDDFKIRVMPTIRKVEVRTIGAIDGQILTEHQTSWLNVQEGEITPDIGKDVLTIGVIERRKATGEIGLGFVTNLNLKKGALASSVAHDMHNIIVVGTNNDDMALAVNTVADVGGGQIAVCDGKVLALLELPVAGIMSDRPIDEVIDKVEKLHEAAKELGSSLKAPYMTLSFLTLPIPALKLTEKGLLDAAKREYVDLIRSEE